MISTFTILFNCSHKPRLGRIRPSSIETMSSRLILILLLGQALIMFSCKKTRIVDGYTDRFAYFSGDSIRLYLNGETQLDNFELDLKDLNGKLYERYRIDLEPQKIQNDSAYKNGFGYKATAEIQLPELSSGIYLFDDKIPIVIKPKNSDEVEILILYNVNTQNAYSKSGGASFYSFDSLNSEHSPILSFHRPMSSEGYTKKGLLSNYSEEFYYWLASQDHSNVGYITDKEMEEFSNIKSAKLLIIPGHSEYWTRKARRNFDQFVRQGSNSLILSGNTMWWQARYNEDMTQIICFKDAKSDPALSFFSMSLPNQSLPWSMPQISSVPGRFTSFSVFLNPPQKYCLSPPSRSKLQIFNRSDSVSSVMFPEQPIEV